MDNEPFVSVINGQSLSDIFNRIWLRDMASEILRPISFRNPLHLKGPVHTMVSGSYWSNVLTLIYRKINDSRLENHKFN